MGNVGGEFLLYLGLLFFIYEVCLGNGQHAVFDQEFRVVFFQFIKKNLVALGYVRFVCRYHKQENTVAFNVPEEAHSDAPALVGALNDAGDIGHHEGAVVVVTDYAQVGFQGGESVVGNLGLGAGDGGQQGALPGVGETHQAYIGQHL